MAPTEQAFLVDDSSTQPKGKISTKRVSRRGSCWKPSGSTKGKSHGSEEVQEMKDNGSDSKANTKDVGLRLTLHNFIVLIFGVLDLYDKTREYVA